MAAGSSSEPPPPAPPVEAGPERGRTQRKHTLVVPPRSWTSGQVAQFEGVVHALGGPFKATASLVSTGMPDGGLSTSQLEYGIAKLRTQMRDAGVSTDVDEALLQKVANEGVTWPADLSETIDATVLALGGLDWATPARILQLVPDTRLTSPFLSNYLTRSRSRVRAKARGSRAGPETLPVAAAAESGSAALKPFVGAGPPRGWSPQQSQQFLVAVRACGGSTEATTRGVSEWMRRACPDSALSLTQVCSGMHRLHETLRHAALSQAPRSSGSHDARASEDAALAILWVQCAVNFRWTPELRIRLEGAVNQLGGPDVAEARHVLPLMAGSGLTNTQVQGGLLMLRDKYGMFPGGWVGHQGSASTGEQLSAAPRGQRRPHRRWTAGQEERFDAAVSQLGGLKRASPEGVEALMLGSGLSVCQVKAHLKWRLVKERCVGVRGGDKAATHADDAPPGAA